MNHQYSQTMKKCIVFACLLSLGYASTIQPVEGKYIHSIFGPIFLRRFKLYMFSFKFGFMFANLCFEKNQNSKIYVMFIINITQNETGICSFWAVWAVRAVGKNQVLTCASLVC